MSSDYIFRLGDQRPPPHIGTKAETLATLARHSFTIPSSWVCTWDAYERYMTDDIPVVTALQSELADTIVDGCRYAVRSSANLEDGRGMSYAGQFKSVLNVQGVDGIISAMWSIWANTHTARVRTYLEKQDVAPNRLRMAILIQEMVPPRIAGVVFSHDPVTGEPIRIIEAVRGPGESLVQGGVTPERWTRGDGVWRTRPSDPILSEQLALEIASQAESIASLVGYPADIEWVYDGDTLHWVQLREITTLRTVNVYSNRIAREYMPGVILPLVWSVNVPLVNGAWIDMLTEMIGPNDLTPERLAKSIRYHAYFNMGALGEVFEELGFPRETLERMRGTSSAADSNGRSGGGPGFRPTLQMLRLLPRMLRFLIDKLRFGRRIEPFIDQAEEDYQRFSAERANQLTPEALLTEIQALREINRRTAYFNVVTPILMQIYDSILRKRLSKLGISLEDVDLRRDAPELEALDPTPTLRALKVAYDRLSADNQARLQESKTGAFAVPSSNNTEMEAFATAFNRFLAHFGHLSDSGNDFSSPRWRETPDLILNLIIHHSDAAGQKETRPRFDALELPIFKRRGLRKLKEKTLRYQVYRERIGSLYTYGQGLFRTYFLALGRTMAERSGVMKPEYIFYLTWDEVVDWVKHTSEQAIDGSALATLVSERRDEVEASRNLELPETIYGDAAPLLRSPEGTTDVLEGIPTAPGQYRGHARVVHGIQDFDKVHPGDVLVVPFTDVGWSPLFAEAGAVVAESGGMLSHSSIVAREYEIPAVVSIHRACRLISDGMTVLVDGYHGRVYLEPVGEEAPEPENQISVVKTRHQEEENR